MCFKMRRASTCDFTVIQKWTRFFMMSKKTMTFQLKITLYNTILRIARNFLETREIIKILIYPCCPKDFDWFSCGWSKKKNFFWKMKISQRFCGSKDGSKFWWFPWFPKNSLLCVILRYTVYMRNFDHPTCSVSNILVILRHLIRILLEFLLQNRICDDVHR